MNLAIQSGYYLKDCPQCGVERIAKLGYKYATCKIKGRYDQAFADFTDDELKNEYEPLGKLFSDKGIKLVYTELASEMYLNYGADNNAAREKMVINSIKATAFMGCNHLLLKPIALNGAGADSVEVSKKITIDIIERLLPVAKEYGVELLISNNTCRNSRIFYCSEPEDLLELYEKYGIKTVFDPVRAYRSMWKFTKSFNMLKDVLFAYQIADIESSVKNPFMPMMGSLDYPEIIKTLAKINEDNKERYAVMIADNVFNRFSQFSSEGLSSSLDELLFKMGKIIVGERE